MPLRQPLRLLAAALAVSLALHGCSKKDDQGVTAEQVRAELRAYDEAADPFLQLASAKQTARRDGKQVLLVFGANWCGDCRVLSAEMKQGRLGEIVSERYVVEKIHIGRYDANTEFTARFGDPAGNGIPSIVVLDPETDAVITRTDGGELRTARNQSADELADFFAGLPS